MTVHDIHDALTLLPSDLITATDRLRTASKSKIIPWKRIISLAACLVLVLSTAMVFREKILSGAADQKAAAPEAPAAAAPMAPENGIITETPAEEAQEVPAADAAASTGGQSSLEPGAEEELCIDHSHRFAEGTEDTSAAMGYCGNMMTTVYLDGAEYSFAGSDSVRLTHILRNLPYDPDEVCRCMAEFTVDTEMLAGIEVNLTEGFARCEQGQAALTEKQAGILQEIIDSLA